MHGYKCGIFRTFQFIRDDFFMFRVWKLFWEIVIVFWSCYTLNIASAMLSESFGFKLRYEKKIKRKYYGSIAERLVMTSSGWNIFSDREKILVISARHFFFQEWSFGFGVSKFNCHLTKKSMQHEKETTNNFKTK